MWSWKGMKPMCVSSSYHMGAAYSRKFKNNYFARPHPPCLPPSPRAKPCACLAWQPLSHSPYFALENLEFLVWKHWWKRKISLALRWTAVVGSKNSFAAAKCFHSCPETLAVSICIFEKQRIFFKALFLMKINHLNYSVGWSSSHLWEEESIAVIYLENLEMVNIPVSAYLRSFC